MQDTNDYIDSGILELYVMGALSPEETADVERRAATDEAVAQEIREIREAIATLDRHHTSTPRASVRSSLIAALDAEESAQAPVGAPRVATIGRLPEPRAARATSTRFALAATWALVVLSVGAAAYFATQWRAAAGELAAAQREADSLRIEMSVIAHHAVVGRHAIDVMHDSAAQIINLAGTEKAPDAHLLVCYHPATSEVHVLSNLPPPPAGKTYQLWAIQGDERIDAGTFEATRLDLIQTQKLVDHADAFAVTIEKAGGSPTPNLDAIVAVGQL